MKRIRPLKSRRLGVAVLAGGIFLGTAAVASADNIGPITFEPAPSTLPYTLGNINGQQGWMKTGPYDANVASVAVFPDASGYGFGSQALRISDAVTSGSFGDQTFSPGLASPAGESAVNRHFEASFRIGTTQASQQPGLHMSVSPDDGQGSRMSYLRFEDQLDGVHVFFDDVTDPGPLGTVATFNETDIATLTRTVAHRIKFSLDLKPGAANDVVGIYIDGKLQRVHGRRTHRDCKSTRHEHSLGARCAGHKDRDATGTTWEDYYRFDPEQTGNGNQVPTVGKLLFRESGDPTPVNVGKGFLVDGVSLLSSNVPVSKRDCKHNGWTTHTRADGSAFKNQGACIKYVKRRPDHRERH